MADHILRHTGVSDAVSGRENRLIVLIINVIQAVRVPLIRGNKRFVRPDDLTHGNLQRRVIDDPAHDQAIRSADNVDAISEIRAFLCIGVFCPQRKDGPLRRRLLG